jgi:hypothetical protein
MTDELPRRRPNMLFCGRPGPSISPRRCRVSQHHWKSAWRVCGRSPRFKHQFGSLAPGARHEFAGRSQRIRTVSADRRGAVATPAVRRSARSTAIIAPVRYAWAQRWLREPRSRGRSQDFSDSKEAPVRSTSRLAVAPHKSAKRPQLRP